MKLVVSLVAAMAATSAFASTPAAAPASKGDPKAAESIVNQVCAACHAVDGNSATAAARRRARAKRGRQDDGRPRGPMLHAN